MPTEERVGFDDEQRFSPGAETTRQQHQHTAILGSEEGALRLAAKHNQLLAQ
jgi:hypothetical protein